MSGEILIPDSLIKTLDLYHPYYADTDFSDTSCVGDTIKLSLLKRHVFDLNYSSIRARPLIDSVLAYRSLNDLDQQGMYSYDSYNKLRVAPLVEDNSQKAIFDILDYFKIDENAISKNHYVLLSESLTKRERLNTLRDKETVTISKISGVSDPKVVSLNSQIQSLNIYQRYISVFDQSYLSPLQFGTHLYYNFRVLDTIHRLQDDLYIIQFNPNGRIKQVLLSGVLFVSSKKWGIETAILAEDKKSGSFFETYFHYSFIDGRWLPKSYSTIVSMKDFIVNDFRLRARYSTYISNFKFSTNLKKSIFDDVAVEFLENSFLDSKFLLANSRREPFSRKDSSTYSYYDTVGSVKNIDKAYEFANNIINKEVKFKNFNLDFNKAFDYNEVEGIRLGIGLNRFIDPFEIVKVGGHFAYGLSDETLKYELYTKINVIRERRLNFFIGLKNETLEAAYTDFNFYSYQYTTEWLRRFSINKMDYCLQYYIGFDSKPIKYTSLALKFLSTNSIPSYTYQYKEKEKDSFQYSDVELGVRFAFGETYFKLLNSKYKLKSPFPILWMKFNWGLDNIFEGEFDYFRADFRFEYKMKSFLLGRAIVQLNSGFSNGDLPYFQLFEGYGANGAAVSHNRFETMRVNEFISDRYFNLFFTYELTKLYFRDYPNFRPTIELEYNFGIGSLSHPEYHKEVSFKTLQEGYHELGLSFKSIVAFRVASVKMGLGVGNYLRLGHYSNPYFKENYVGKVFITFSL